jgi:hypothetical protein
MKMEMKSFTLLTHKEVVGGVNVIVCTGLAFKDACDCYALRGTTV